MFIVKAEVIQAAGTRSYQIYEAEAVRVAPSTMCSATSASHVPAPIDPDMDVELTDIDGRVKRTLYVGSGIDHYCAAYIMNAQGKTVDTVYPHPANAPAQQVYAVGSKR